MEATSCADTQSCPPCAPGGIPAFALRLGLAAALAGQGMVFNLGYNTALAEGEAPEYGSTTYWLLHGALIASAVGVLLLLGGPLLRQLVAALREGRISVEAMFFLSALGALGGSLISTFSGEGSVYYEIVAVVVCVYAIGKQVGVQQRGKVGQAVAAIRRTFDHVYVEDAVAGRRAVSPGQLRAGDIVVVAAGEPIPVDGQIESGGGYLRETAFTGEPGPVKRGEGDRVFAGTWSLDASLRIKPIAGHERAMDRLIQLVEQAGERPSRVQVQADELMAWFVPTVLAVATATFLGWWLFAEATYWRALFNAMAVLLVACPCALGLATPAGIWAGLFHLSQRGLVGRSGPLVDYLADCTDLVFDKTGTLTDLNLVPGTESLRTGDLEKGQLCAMIASLAAASPHPVNASLAQLSADRLPVHDFIIYPGEGIGARVAGHSLLIGDKSLRRLLASPEPADRPSSPACDSKQVEVFVDGQSHGFLHLHERLRDGAVTVLDALADLGCRCHILSGDPAPAFTAIGGVPIQANCSPEDKAAAVRQLQDDGKTVLFIGDGINDVAAMEAAHAALAIDSGTAVATEYADGLLAQGRLQPLPAAIRMCRRLRARLRANLRFALAYNITGMTLAAAGWLHPVAAALLMVVSSLIVSLRALRSVED